MDRFVLKAPYQPSGDQPQAIEALAEGVRDGLKDQILLGVTGGYLLCYPILAWICGRLDELLEKKGMAVSFAMITAMTAGTAVLYACGTIWFVILTKMQFTAALAVCVIPFLPGDLLKMAVCVLIVPQIRKALEARR